MLSAQFEALANYSVSPTPRASEALVPAPPLQTTGERLWRTLSLTLAKTILSLHVAFSRPTRPRLSGTTRKACVDPARGKTMIGGWVQYVGGAFLGWCLGANDSANVFGAAVSSGMVRYRLAVFLTAAFIALGALLQGQEGIETLSKGLRKNDVQSVDNVDRLDTGTENDAMEIAVIISLAAAAVVAVMTLLKLPASTSQAVIGAIAGAGIARGDANWEGLGKVLVCWIGTPLGGAFFAIAFYHLFKWLLAKWKPSVFEYDPAVRLGLLLCGCYGAYALGANSVANVAAVFVGKGMLSTRGAAVFGAVCIAIGTVTYSKSVMMTVGKGIVRLDAFSAFVCVLSLAVTMHIYAMLGVPVSNAQAIVGALLGVGMLKGAQTIRFKTLFHVLGGWVATPIVAGAAAAAGCAFVG